MRRGGENTAEIPGVVVVAGTQVGNKVGPVELPVKLVDLGYFGFELLAVALRQAAHHIEVAYLTGLLGLDHLQNHLDGFLFGVTDETAGIDHHIFARHLLGVVTHFITGFGKAMHQPFRIDQILGTAQRNNIDAILYHLDIT